MISPPVGVDDEVGDEIRPRRLDQDVGPFFRAAAALGVAHDPAHGVAGGDRAGADELLFGFERDVGDLANVSANQSALAPRPFLVQFEIGVELGSIRGANCVLSTQLGAIAPPERPGLAGFFATVGEKRAATTAEPRPV
jgi:hypothetical protein